ncbi:MAG TPA: hypothetical protein VFS13_08025 [Steroidobacteraceae bacterium]|nr:hypothetical protein [Steroidobacteraceae bacterium]
MWRAILAYFNELLDTIKRLETKMGAVADALAGVQNELAKAKTEIVGKISDLETQLANAGKLDGADQAAIDAVKAAAADLDSIVPDAPVEPPVTDQPADVPPADQPPADENA